MKSLLVSLSLMFTFSAAQAAITSDIDCSSKDGKFKLYYETTPNWTENGDIDGENLYRDISVTVKGIEVRYEPTSVSIGRKIYQMNASSKDGSYVIIKATNLLNDHEDEATYTGTMEYAVKTKDGFLRAPKGTKIVCTVNGEA